MKVSFDWDSCLAEPRQQEIARKFIENGDEVWIITSRQEADPPQGHWSNKIVFKIAENLGIPKERIVFTSYEAKWISLDKFGIDLHFDDDITEIELIEENKIKCKGVLILDP
jgi:hypothetical protein